MRKSLTILLGLVCMAYITGCGSGTTTSTITYDSFPVPFVSYSAVVAGKIPKGPLAFKNYSVSTFAGSSAGFSNHSTATSPVAKFNRPLAVTTDGIYLYVADYLNNVIRRINIALGTDTTVAGSIAGLAGLTDATGTAASFNLPRDITTDGKNLYVADSGNYTIRKIDMTTWAVTVLAGAAGQPGSVDAPIGTNARFNVINGITTDGRSLYVTDSNNTIRRIVINSPSPVTTLAGTAGATGSTDDTKGAALFNLPTRLTTDGQNLYVTDFGNSTIRKIDLKTGTVTTIAGKVGPGGAPGKHADSTDGTGQTARFNQPNGITTDGVSLYVTDSFDSTIRKIVISSGIPGSVYSGPVTTIAGIPAVSDKDGNIIITTGSKDGYGPVATFDEPTGITTDGTSLYIVDALNHRIRKIQSGK